ncbi:MAG: ACP S-malonyltransferase [Candidatus Paceibacterota bacterium]
MLRGILPDANCEGHFAVVLRVLHDEERRVFWHYLNLAVPTFQDLGLAADASDRILWEQCQQQEVILITANRNAKGADSLEATIRSSNTPGSLPVLTLGNVERIRRDRQYAADVADCLLDYLFSIDDFRGAGRLFLP